MKKRCDWVTTDPLYIAYHDEEWGVPVHNDRKLFEMLILEGAQAGLSWITILRRREAYRKAFDQLVPETVAGYTEERIEELVQNAEIIRNRLKIKAAVENAKAFLRIQQEFGSFDTYIWQFVGGEPILNHWTSRENVPTTSRESDAMSKDLKKRGFKFVGSTICYAYMEATGMVQDHTMDCFRYKELNGSHPKK